MMVKARQFTGKLKKTICDYKSHIVIFSLFAFLTLLILLNMSDVAPSEIPILPIKW